MLVDGTLDLNGVRLALDRALGLNLWDVRGPVSALTQVTGLYPNGTWSGRVVVYHRAVAPVARSVSGCSATPASFAARKPCV